MLLKLLSLGFRVREIPATLEWLDAKLQRAGSAKRKSSTNVLKTINSHLRFIAIAQPVRHFAVLAASACILGFAFLFAAVVTLVTKAAPAIFLALVGLTMMVISLLFGGFSIVFFQMRELARMNWMRGYGTQAPPAARPAFTAFPPAEN